ncbi:hypothetical protein AV530_011434 [Patagioenas fasciata monilis]|uniref:Uncharacterized protein n=1 Tax=Patagioenas fasciata monilis TaxID=372326 RepID=A0A1V4KPA3_PATFA|nr:hypothetical protein AV530_011434 [Patagioenas fasciata monilis]
MSGDMLQRSSRTTGHISRSLNHLQTCVDLGSDQKAATLLRAGSDTEGKFIRCTWRLGKYSASFTYKLAFNYLTATNHPVPAHVLAKK